MPLVIGIDIGTQSLKAVVLGDGFQVLGESAVCYSPLFPGPGWAEQQPAAWEESLAPAIDTALKRAGASPGDVAALAVAGQLDGCLAVDRAGEPLGNCLIWMDRRAGLQVRGVDPELVKNRAGIILDPGHMAAKIRWLMENGAGEAALYHQPVSYIVSRLTGRAVMDHALASTTMLYSLEQRGWDPELLAAFAVAEEQLPAVAPAHSRAGELTPMGAKLTGLPQGIPVAVGTGDDYSTPLGAGMVEPGAMVCVLGTAEVVGALDRLPKIDPGGLVETHGYFGDCFFIENPGWLSGGAVEWFIETFRFTGIEEMSRQASLAEPGSAGVNFLPALSGAMAPEWIDSARGCFYGLTPSHGAAEMARSLLEGSAFAMRDVLERLREMEVPASEIILLGGGARSEIWARIRASVSGLPVRVPERVDTSPVGAAMLAAVAAGLAPDLTACAGAVDIDATTFEPEPRAAKALDEAYLRYRTLFECLKPMYGADHS